jgi:hypothetical protein
VQALVDVDDEAEVHITLLHTLHGLIHIVNVNHLQRAAAGSKQVAASVQSLKNNISVVTTGACFRPLSGSSRTVNSTAALCSLPPA